MNSDELSQDEVDRRFATQMFDDSRRIFYCAAGQLEAVEEMVAAKGWSDMVEVKVSSLILNEGNVYVVDQNAINAAMAKHFQGRLL